VVPCHGTEGRGVRRLFGGRTLASDLGRLNLLAATPAEVRLVALGGRTGMRPKDEVAAWPRGQVAVTATPAVRSSYYASTGSSYDYPVFELRITAPDAELVVDLLDADPHDAEVLGDGPRLEIEAELQRFLAATGGSVTRA
jgi:hypothetical protein